MKIDDWKEHIERMARDPARYGLDCVLCKSKAVAVVGVLFPSEEMAKLLQQPDKKHRTVFYGLCDKCSKLKDAAQLAEAQIENELLERDGPPPLITATPSQVDEVMRGFELGEPGSGKSAMQRLVSRMRARIETLTRWWCVDTNSGELFPKDKVVVMELYKASDDGALKKFVVDANGDMYLPDLARQDDKTTHKVGRLIASWDSIEDFPQQLLERVMIGREVLICEAHQ
jgi:hypothetical protein